MLTTYPACFFKEEEGYSIVFPDLNYLGTCGTDLNNAVYMAIDCLAGYLFSEKLDGNEIPAASPIHSISLQAVAKELDISVSPESFTNLVSVNVDDYAKRHFSKSVKKTLTIPEWLNEKATAAGINFSQVLQKALREQLRMTK